MWYNVKFLRYLLNRYVLQLDLKVLNVFCLLKLVGILFQSLGPLTLNNLAASVSL